MIFRLYRNLYEIREKKKKEVVMFLHSTVHTDTLTHYSVIVYYWLSSLSSCRESSNASHGCTFQ